MSDPPVLRLFTEIGIIDQLVTTLLERSLPGGLTRAQFGILHHLARLGGAWGPARLARAFQVTKQTMTATLTRLEAQGLVSIRPDPRDGRAKRVTITPAGLAARQQAVSALADLLRQDDLFPSDAEAEALLPGLAAIRARLDRARSRT
ncbi:MAG: MarR family transcriptional regulator [Sphingomonadaceae bacterium]